MGKLMYSLAACQPRCLSLNVWEVPSDRLGKLPPMLCKVVRERNAPACLVSPSLSPSTFCVTAQFG